MLKIAYLGDVLDYWYAAPPSGIHIYAEELARALSTIVDLKLIHYTQQRTWISERIDLIVPTVRDYSNSLIVFDNLSRRALKLSEAISRSSPHLLYLPQFMTSLLPCLLSLPHIPKLITVHDVHALTMKVSLKEKLQMIISRYVAIKLASMIPRTYIATVSETAAEGISRYLGINRDDIFVIPAGVDTKQFSPQDKQKSLEMIKAKFNIRYPFILYVGRVEKGKGVHLLIQAYRLLMKESIKHSLLLVGPTSPNALKTLGVSDNEEDLSSKIVLLGPIRHEHLPYFFSATDLFVYTGLHDSFGMPVVEALACGTPTIVFKNTMPAKLVGNAGVQADKGDINDLANCISSLINSLLNPEVQAELTAQSLKRAQLFDWNRSAQKALYVFKIIMKRLNGS